MNCKLFNKIVIWIAIIALAITPMVYFIYFVGIGAIWTTMNSEASPITATATVVLALTSIVVALVGFFTYFRENEKNRIEKADADKRDRLLVKPRIKGESLDVTAGNIRRIKIKLDNLGSGPALIKSFVLSFDGKEIVRNDSQEYCIFLKEKIAELNGFSALGIGFLTQGSIVNTSDENLLWDIKYDNKLDPDGENIDIIKKLNVTVEYQSIYEDEIFTYDVHEDMRSMGLEPL